ncbi:hypothetical protein GCM10022237_05960 [Nocardioides ginsengisoli]
MLQFSGYTFATEASRVNLDTLWTGAELGQKHESQDGPSIIAEKPRCTTDLERATDVSARSRHQDRSQDSESELHAPPALQRIRRPGTPRISLRLGSSGRASDGLRTDICGLLAGSFGLERDSQSSWAVSSAP